MDLPTGLWDASGSIEGDDGPWVARGSITVATCLTQMSFFGQPPFVWSISTAILGGRVWSTGVFTHSHFVQHVAVFMDKSDNGEISLHQHTFIQMARRIELNRRSK